jgi:hypothetical protein
MALGSPAVLIVVVSVMVIVVILVMVVGIIVVSIAGWNTQYLAGVNIVGVVQAICPGNSIGVNPITPANAEQGFAIANPMVTSTAGRRSRLTIGNVDGLQQNNSQNNWEYLFKHRHRFHITSLKSSKKFTPSQKQEIVGQI